MSTTPITPITPIRFAADHHLLVLTGAGISAESGVPTFRDSNGLWEGNRVEEVASPDGFAADPLKVWRFYSERRAKMAGIEPNAGHRALVEIERRLGDRFLLMTQNIDGLHAAAGSERMVEMHGNLMTSRCTVCDRAPFEDRSVYRAGVAPMCGQCAKRGVDALLRPHIVWFGEQLPATAMARLETFVNQGRGNLRFVAIGTSGLVFPAAGIVDVVRRMGGRSWLVNAERPANVSSFDDVLIGPAGTILPTLLAA